MTSTMAFPSRFSGLNELFLAEFFDFFKCLLYFSSWCLVKLYTDDVFDTTDASDYLEAPDNCEAPG